jgi:hypothetical protein
MRGQLWQLSHYYDFSKIRKLIILKTINHNFLTNRVDTEGSSTKLSLPSKALFT